MITAEEKIKFSIIGIIFLSLILLLPVIKSVLITDYPIRHIRVTGALQYIKQESINTAIEPLVATGYFFADLELIRQALVNLPWSKTAQVKRIWPDRIELDIVERDPIVQWHEDGLLNSKGVIFIPPSIEAFSELPILSVPEKQRVELLLKMQFLMSALKKQSLKLKSFQVTQRQSWLLGLENGLLIQLGHIKPLEKFKLLMKALTLTEKAQVKKMAYIDMRYPNGYAVRWQ